MAALISTLGALLLSNATVTLPMEARTNGTQLTLGELGVVQSADAELRARLEAFDLGYAPAPGFSRLVRADWIEERVETALPGVDLVLGGQHACRVWPQVEHVDAAAIRATAATELARWVGTNDATWEPTGSLETVMVPSGDRPVELRVRMPEPVLSPGTLAVPVQVLVDGTPYRTVWTSWRIEVFETLPVLVRPVRVAEVLRASDFEARRMPVRGVGSARALTGSMLVGATAARDLSAGSVVTGLDVHRPLLVSTGRNVQLEAVKGPITARVSALALESGAVGDRVRVRTLDGGRELTASVIGRDLVRVDLGTKRTTRVATR